VTREWCSIESTETDLGMFNAQLAADNVRYSLRIALPRIVSRLFPAVVGRTNVRRYVRGPNHSRPRVTAHDMSNGTQPLNDPCEPTKVAVERRWFHCR
jgi:hypothetical protein